MKHDFPTVVPGLLKWGEPRRVETRFGPRLVREANITPEFARLLEDPENDRVLRRMGFSPRGSRVTWFQKIDEPEEEAAPEPKPKPKPEAHEPIGLVNERRRRYETSFAPDIPGLASPPLPPGEEAYRFQVVGAREILERKRILLADEMGLGKTIQTILTINGDESIETALVICPRALKENWKREIERFGFRLNTEIIIISGKKRATLRPMIAKLAKAPRPKELRVVIINYDILPFWEHVIKAPAWDLIVLDEAHEIKNYESKRSAIIAGGKIQDAPGTELTRIRERINFLTEREREARLNRDHARVLAIKKEVTELTLSIPKPRRSSGLEARYKIALTGTPIVNRVSELIPVLKWLGYIGRDLPFGLPGRFIDRYSFGDPTSRKASNIDELHRLLREEVMIRRLKCEVLKELPGKTRTIIEIPFRNEKLAAAETEAFAAFDNRIDGLKLAVDLARISRDDRSYRAAISELRDGRRIAIEEMSEIRLQTAREKIPFAISHMKAAREPIVVFAHHRTLLLQLEKSLTASGRACGMVIGQQSDARRQEAIDEFQAGNLDYILCSMRAASVGLTLTAARRVVFLESDWTSAIMRQAEDRVHRIGQKRDVIIELLVLAQSFDAKMAKIVLQKAELEEKILNSRDTFADASSLEDDELEELYIERQSKKLARHYTETELGILKEGVRRLQTHYDRMLGRTMHRRPVVIGQSNAAPVEVLVWKWRKILGSNFLPWRRK